MTKRETEIVKKAIEDLMAENGDFCGAIAGLCRLVGWRYPAGEMQTKSVSWMNLSDRLKEASNDNDHE